MNILICSRNFLPDLGGLERNTLTLATALTRLGHVVTVLTQTLADDGESRPFKTIRSHGLKTLFTCIKHADLIFINGGLSMKACALALLLNKKYVPVYQTSELYLRENSGWFSRLSRRYVAGSATLSITVSHHAGDVLAGLLPGRTVHALPNPIDSELEEISQRLLQESRGKSFDLLFAGRMIDGKGIFQLVDAVAGLRPRMNLTVAFAGDGEHKDALLAYAREKDICFSYLGRLDKACLVEAYMRARVLVVPSTTHTEGNPLVIAEALSLGTPVIASDQPAMVEAVGNAGCVFRRGDVFDLSDKIALLFSGENLSRATDGTEGRKHEFSYQLYVERLKQVFSLPSISSYA